LKIETSVPDVAERKVSEVGQPAVSATPAVVPVKKTLWQRVVDECKHYYR
jgi:hypothetical protein